MLGPAQDRKRRADSSWDRPRLTPHPSQRQQFKLRLVIERSPTSQTGPAPLDTVGQSGQGLATQQPAKTLQVGIDGKNVDSLGAQESC